MYRHFHGRFFKSPHKFWEAAFHWTESGKWTTYFSADITANRRTDHAGFRFSLGIMRLYIEFQIYDHRHWNHDAERWNRHGVTDTELDDWL